MILCLRLSYMDTTWERRMTAVLDWAGHGKGTWHLTKVVQACSPWGLLALDYQGTFTYRASAKALEFWCKDAKDGLTTLSFMLFDAPASPHDESRLCSDGDIRTTRNPVGESCDLSWTRLFETL
jgi:hypothetical protein